MKYYLVVIAILAGLFAKSQIVVTSGLSEAIRGLPGDLIYIDIDLRNNGLEPTKAKLTITDYYVTCDSGYVYKPAGSTTNSASTWISQDLNEVTLKSKEKVTIRLQVIIPDNFRGNHATANIFVTNEPVIEEQEGINFSIGFASRYAINLIYTPLDATNGHVDLLATDIKLDTAGNNVLKIKYLNSGTRSTTYTCELELISPDGDVVFKANTPSNRIQPNQCRDLVIPITKSIAQGKYQLILVATADNEEAFGMTRELSF